MLLVLVVCIAKGQPPQPSDFNTAAGNAVVGTHDAYWEVAKGDTTQPTTPFVPATIVGNCDALWFNANSLYPANWITYDQGNGCYHVGGGGDFYFQRKITLPDLNECGRPIGEVFCFEIAFYADNCIQSVHVNGVLNYQHSGSALCDNLKAPAKAQACQGWHPGDNLLTVHVKSTPLAVGFLAVAARKSPLQADFLGRDTVVCTASTYTLVSNSEQTHWFDQSVGLTKTVHGSGVYWAAQTNEDGCEVRDTIGVYFSGDCYLPNVFSPDLDGVNDDFSASFDGIPPPDFHLWIFDRWGNLAYQSNDPTEGWDGTHGGTIYPSGVYTYLLRAGSARCQVHKSGSVLLVR